MEESGYNSGSHCRCISGHEIRGTCDAPISFRLASGTRHTSGSQVAGTAETLQKTAFYRRRCGRSADSASLRGRHSWGYVASPGSVCTDQQADSVLSGNKERILPDHRPMLQTGGIHGGNSGPGEQPVYLYAAQ